jgi:hypothetical protein
MAENESFFRKVVRFVANPATDWTELGAQPEEARELEIEKSELKAMIERKRRNDFVRKREFDMLRRVRREGLTPEQLAALGTSSRLDDSEVRQSETITPRLDSVKAKIDAIEQQMVGDAGFHTSRGDRSRGPQTVPASTFAASVPSTPRPAVDISLPTLDEPMPGFQPAPSQPLPVMNLPSAAAPAQMQLSIGLPPLAPLSSVSFEGAAGGSSLSMPHDFDTPFAVEVSEVVHDPELDEAVIAFANADFTQCEDALRQITKNGGARSQHAETWLVLFDLYRATGQQQSFESLAVEYAHQFGWSAPQWYSLPRLVADAQTDEPTVESGRNTRDQVEVGWVCPEHLDIESVARLGSQTLQMPLPWVFEWQGLHSIDAEAAVQMTSLFRGWSAQALELRWLNGEHLFDVLAEATPSGVRDVDPAFWLARLEALRLANRVALFDEAAIEYCITYEVSPPSWEPTRCKVHVSGSVASTRSPPMSIISDVSTSFMESSLVEQHGGGVEMAHVELSGQLVGDIGATLNKLLGQLHSASVVSVSCARLIRVDFIAAGDLLNWVLSRKHESRAVHFVDTHRLVALFFGAMGINEHAKVQVRKV